MEQAIQERAPTADGEPLFEEVQDLPWPFVALGLGAGATGALAAARTLSLAARVGVVGVVVGGLGLAMREFLAPMTTRVLPGEIQVRFGKRTRFRVPLKNVVRVYPRSYNAITEYGGWGIRIGPAGRAFNVRGGQGVQLELRSGQRLLIGSQHPAELAQVVQRLTGYETPPEPDIEN